MVSPFMPDTEKVAAIRGLLPATSAGIYLNTGSVGPLSSETAAAMREIEDRALAVGRGDPATWLNTLDRLDEARAGVGAVLATDIERIAVTHSTTDGLNAVLLALPWRAGDRVVTTAHEHPAVVGPLVALRERLGVEIDLVDIADDADDAAVVAALGGSLARGARALVVSHVLWTTGRVLPVAALTAAARSAGAWSIVDGAQAVGAITARPDELEADAYALPAQKWLLGPEGMGALWLGDRALDELTPAIAGSLGFALIRRTGEARWHPGARRFEATGFHPPSIVGFARACGWLSMYVGLPWAIERATSLAAGLMTRLAAIPGVSVLTPPGASATLVTFRIASWEATAIVEELSGRVFAITRDIPDIGAARLSVGCWNTEEELERVAVTIELLAAHTPETIPPRRRLAVLGSDGRPLG